MRAGAHIDEGHLAADLAAEGISPARAAVRFQHPTSKTVTTALDIARTAWSETFGGPTNLSDLLDAAGVERTKRPNAGGSFHTI